MTVVRAVGRSHLGRVRRRNEDAWFVGPSLTAVADGLGGHVAGDVASAVVVDTMRLYDRAAATEDPAVVLGRAVAAANEALRGRIADQPGCAGMGSTLVAMAWSGPNAVLANVGDSRAYLLRNDSLRQLTEDHVYGNLVGTSDQVPGLPERLSRFLDGRADGRSPDLLPLALRPGDRILLCSDGLSTPVPAAEIRSVLAADASVAELADRLVAAALAHGGPDNVTAVLVEVS